MNTGFLAALGALAAPGTPAVVQIFTRVIGDNNDCRRTHRSFAATPIGQAGCLPMTTQDLIAQAMVLAYRLAGYALDNMAEDAALLALVFC